jgi:hypothetical protein
MTRGFLSGGDLFGRPEPMGGGGSNRSDLVDVALVAHRTGNAAWLLSDSGDPDDAKWLPFSVAERGEGKDANVWTMPRWIARDRGWV